METNERAVESKSKLTDGCHCVQAAKWQTVQHALPTAVTRMVNYSTSVESFSSDLVLSDRYTIDIQPVEATNLELI